MLGAVERIFRRWRPGGFRPGEPLALCVCLLLSGVMVYTIERGNSALNVMVMILWAFALRDSERPWERELALLLIAVAAGFKVYPCIFGLLYLFERRWPWARCWRRCWPRRSWRASSWRSGCGSGAC